MSSINTSFAPVTYIVAITCLLFGAVFSIDMAFTQIKRIGQEQIRYSHLTGKAKPANEITDFSHVELNGQFNMESHASLMQLRKPVTTGFAHVGIFDSKEFGPQIVMYDWDQTKIGSLPKSKHLSGLVLPFSLLQSHPIFREAQEDWHQYFKDHQLDTPPSFVLMTNFPNLTYFQNLYYPKYATHYSYALQFFVISISLTVIAGYLLKRGFTHVK